MSDHDRCSIPLLSLSSLLDVAPALAFSVNLHRDLLGIPRSSPFRQYTRLTVSVDTPSQAQVLNSGNPVLKTYDFVAVKPLSQTAFDHACLKSEVCIIIIAAAAAFPFYFFCCSQSKIENCSWVLYLILILFYLGGYDCH
jgi:ribonuclease P/MRP protein subunit RPP1